MALKDCKITTEDIEDNGVQAMDDVPKGTPEQIKAMFDNFVTTILQPRYVGLINELLRYNNTTFLSGNASDCGAKTLGCSDISVTIGGVEYKLQKGNVYDSLAEIFKQVKQVESGEITEVSVDTENLIDGAVTNAKIDDNTIEYGKIKDGTITSAKIGSKEVKTTNIDSGAVEETQLGTSAVSTAKLKDASNVSGSPTGITEAKIENGAVSKDKLTADAVMTSKLNAFVKKSSYSEPDANSTVKEALENLVKLAELAATHMNTTSGNPHHVTASEAGITAAQIGNIIYPVGSIYITTSNVPAQQPATLFGGTWKDVGTGRVLVGAGIGTDKNNINKSFTAMEVTESSVDYHDSIGEYEHQLSINELASHTHIQNPHNHSYSFDKSAGSQKRDTPCAGQDATAKVQTNYVNSTTATNNNTGGDLSHNNIQPTFACYIWCRLTLAS